MDFVPPYLYLFASGSPSTGGGLIVAFILKKLSRRGFVGGALIGAVAATAPLAQTVTAESPLGPFFPTVSPGQPDADQTPTARLAQPSSRQGNVINGPGPTS